MIKLGSKDFNEENALVNKYFCNFIADKFLRKFKDQNGRTLTQNEYAKYCGLSSSTITKLKLNEGYDVPMSTVYNICRFEKISIASLLIEFDEKYGINIQS